MFYTYHLEQASKVQCLAVQSGQSLITPTPDICRKAVHDLLNFEKDLGFRDWQALKPLLEK